MKRLTRVVTATALLSIGLCGWSHAHVLEQAPSKAVGVFEVKNLQGLSTKVAKFAKTLGVDQFDPRWADPLASLMDTMDVKQGLNKNGDMAIAFFNPDKKGSDAPKDDNAAADANEPALVVLVPTDDYKAFLGNFTDVKSVGGDISQVTVAKNHETLFMINRGKYAVAAKDKALLDDHGGIKLTAAAAKEADAKDAIVYVDVAALRPAMEKGMKQARDMINAQAKPKDGAPADPNANPLANPQMKQMLDMYMNLGDRLAKETRAATFSFNITDTGIAMAALGEFEPDSDLGKLVAKVKNTDAPLATGLPDATYFAFGGAVLTPEVTNQLFTDFVEPMIKNLPAEQKGEALTKAMASVKDAMAAMNSVSFGYAAKDGAANDGLISVVGLAHGDANKILASQKESLPAINSLMGMGGGKMTADIQMGEPKTINDVKLETYTVKFTFDPKDPAGAQAQQMLSLIYGHNGLTGAMGTVNPDTFLSVQGGDDKLIGDTIAAAKKNDAALETAAQVKLVSDELPKQRALEYYIALDNIAAAGVKFAKQQGLAVPFKLPPNLPPIGVSIGTDGTTARGDALIPTQLVQSITAAAMQAFMQMQGGAGKGGGI
jgi:hypothetical protein